MTAPKMTREEYFENSPPDCPHCGADMEDAQISYGDLVWGWPVTSFVAVMDDGYAPPYHKKVSVHCQSCRKPSVVAFDARGPKLLAQRTEKDIEHLRLPPHDEMQEFFDDALAAQVAAHVG